MGEVTVLGKAMWGRWKPEETEKGKGLWKDISEDGASTFL
jgi:hypothetical protein